MSSRNWRALRALARARIIYRRAARHFALASILLLAIAAIIYFWLVNTGEIQFWKVCSKGEYGPPDHCAYYDVVSAVVARFLVWLDDHNGLVAAFAGIIVAIATAFLFRATDRLAVSTDDLARGARDQIAELKLARALAEKQYELADKQFLLAGRQADLAERQHGIQRLQYYAEHRPAIKIRSVGVFEADDTPLAPGYPLKTCLVIWNCGDSDAVITMATYLFFMTDVDLPMIPPRQEQWEALISPELLPLTIEGHGSFYVEIESGITQPTRRIVQGGIERLYLMGAIKYEDGLGKERWMGFCRVYDPPRFAGGEGRFVPVDNPDYEYSD